MKSSEVSIKTRSTPASLTIQGQVTKDTTVKWSIKELFLNTETIVVFYTYLWSVTSKFTVSFVEDFKSKL